MRPTDFAEPEATARVLEALRTQGQYSGELLARRKNGSEFEILLLANTTRDVDGRVVNLVASFLDISASKRVQAQLLQACRSGQSSRLGRSPSRYRAANNGCAGRWTRRTEGAPFGALWVSSGGAEGD